MVEENALRIGHLEAIAHGAVKHSRELAHYAWFLMETDKDQNLWASDCPVVLHNDEEGLHAGLGLVAPGVQIYMPMTSNLLLVCWHPVVAGRFIKEQTEARHLLGKLKVQSIVGLNPDKSRLLTSISHLESRLAPIDVIVRAIRSKGSVKASPDNVLFYNWLQFQWSHRFILCAKGQFAQALSMLKRHPELKTGIRMGDAFSDSTKRHSGR